MRILFAAQPGLFADVFSLWLSKLSAEAHVVRCDRSVDSLLPEVSGLQVALLDLDGLPEDSAVIVVSGFRRALEQIPVVVICSSLDEGFVSRVAAAGAEGYLPKSYSEAQALGVLGSVMRRATRVREEAAALPPGARAPGDHGRKHPYGLTPRELEVLELACSGLPNLEISNRCGISEGVVKLHLHHAYQKLGVQGRLQAARIVDRLDSIRQLRIGQSEDGGSLLDWLLPHMSHERHRKGDVLFRKGAPGNALYYVQKGRVRLPELDVEMVEGDLFGEIGIFSPGHARTCSARCETDAHLFRLTAEEAKRLCFENPQFAYYVIRLIADRLVEERAQLRGGH
jgi:two-component system nitrate/nitrite response regulator NarL